MQPPDHLPLRSTRRLLSLGALGLLLGSCNLPQPQADPVRYFTLTTPATGVPLPDAARVLPVQVAGHLRNRSVAVRVSEQEVRYLDEVVWAEALPDGLTQVVRNRLAGIPGGGTVQIVVQRCEPNRAQGNTIQFVATYEITTAQTGASAIKGVFTAAPRTWEGTNPTDLVSQLQAAVAEFADHLAERIASKPISP